MYDYITKELIEVVEASVPVVPGLRAISGHSMGGHGALTIAMKNPAMFTSVSAFAPIVNPTTCPWGEKAFKAYLGSVEAGKAHDATELLKANGPFKSLPMKITQGKGDTFYVGDVNQLQPQKLVDVAKSVAQPNFEYECVEGDHSYFMISTYIDQHLAFHAAHLETKASKLRAAAVAAQKSALVTSTKGQPIRCKAAVAYEAKKPLVTEEILVAPPQAGEVRVKVLCNAVCHTDVYTLHGHDPEGLFPSILGHEAVGLVESIGDGVTSLAVGDMVVPCYTPQCKDCIFCADPRTNLCPKIRATQGKGVMPDGSTRFKRASDGKEIFHFMGCSTFSEYTVISEISAAKVNPCVIPENACLFGCGVATGFGAVWNTSKVTQGSSVGVFGLGAVGLAVVQAAKIAGAKRIIGIDINSKKFSAARALGCTDTVNPSDRPDVPMQQQLIEMTKWGIDFTFDCTGNTDVMRAALEASHRGWGTSCIIGVASAGKEVSSRPFQFITGRTLKGTAFGGWKSRDAVPDLIDRHLSGDLPVAHYITHRFDGVDKYNDAIDTLEAGDCLRAVVSHAKL